MQLIIYNDRNCASQDVRRESRNTFFPDGENRSVFTFCILSYDVYTNLPNNILVNCLIYLNIKLLLNILAFDIKC